MYQQFFLLHFHETKKKSSLFNVNNSFQVLISYTQIRMFDITNYSKYIVKCNIRNLMLYLIHEYLLTIRDLIILKFLDETVFNCVLRKYLRKSFYYIG